MTLAFISSDGRSLSQLLLMPAWSHLPPPPSPALEKGLRLPDHLFVQIMLRSRLCRAGASRAPTASCLSRDNRSDRSSLIAEKSRSTQTCVTGGAAIARVQGRTAVGHDVMKSHKPFLWKYRWKVGMSSMTNPERRLLEGPNFKEVPQFLKSYRILLGYGLTSNEDQSFIKESCFAFLL